MKRIVVCCDGTWDHAGLEGEEAAAPTNVARIAGLIAPCDADGVEQIVFYEGGAATGPWGKSGAKPLGLRIGHSINECYRFVASRFAVGDEIWLFGFSRGGYTARSVIGMIRNSGILRREHLDKIPLAYELYRNRFPETHPDSGYASGFRESFSLTAPIKFLGAWDTVGQFGQPESVAAQAAMEGWSFHDLALSSIVENAYHAVAMDEPRQDYKSCLWESSPATAGEQLLFPGVHRDVGGGYRESGLSDCTLAWMICKARSCGLAFVPERVAVAPDSSRNAARRTSREARGGRGRAETGPERSGVAVRGREEG